MVRRIRIISNNCPLEKGNIKFECIIKDLIKWRFNIGRQFWLNPNNWRLSGRLFSIRLSLPRSKGCLFFIPRLTKLFAARLKALDAKVMRISFVTMVSKFKRDIKFHCSYETSIKWLGRFIFCMKLFIHALIQLLLPCASRNLFIYIFIRGLELIRDDANHLS